MSVFKPYSFLFPISLPTPTLPPTLRPNRTACKIWLIDVLISALQTYKAQNTPFFRIPTQPFDLATPQDVGAEPIPVVVL